MDGSMAVNIDTYINTFPWEKFPLHREMILYILQIDKNYEQMKWQI